MASNFILRKLMQLSKLSKCATTILLGVLLSQPQNELCNLGSTPINLPLN